MVPACGYLLLCRLGKSGGGKEGGEEFRGRWRDHTRPMREKRDKSRVFIVGVWVVAAYDGDAGARTELIEKRRQNERDVCWVLCLVSFLRFVEAARGKTEAVFSCLFVCARFVVVCVARKNLRRGGAFLARDVFCVPAERGGERVRATEKVKDVGWGRNTILSKLRAKYHDDNYYVRVLFVLRVSICFVRRFEMTTLHTGNSCASTAGWGKFWWMMISSWARSKEL